MKKLTSIQNPLFNTLEKAQMKQVLGGVSDPITGTAASIIVTGHSNGPNTNDGTTPASNNDGPGDVNG